MDGNSHYILYRCVLGFMGVKRNGGYMKEKIWCIDCEHYDNYFEPEESCFKYRTKQIKNPIHPDYGVKNGDVFVLNRNNNCKGFEEKKRETAEEFEKRMKEYREETKRKYFKTTIDKIFEVIFFALGAGVVIMLASVLYLAICG